MKKQLSIRSLRIFGVSAILAASLNLGIQAQPRPMKETSTFEPLERLEEFMLNSAMTLKYEAPDELSAAAEQENALNDLNIFAENNANAIKYSAPQEFVDPSVRDLELLAVSMMDGIKYEAPSEERNNRLAAGSDMTVANRNYKPINVEVYRTPNERWLINAGYYKSSRTPAWTKVRKTFSRTNDRQLASEF